MKIFNISLIALSITLLVSCTGNKKKNASEPLKLDSGQSDERKPMGGEKEKRSVCDALKEGPIHSSEHGPMDNADLNRNGTVMREELESFMDKGQYRRITILTFFEQFDEDKNGKLSHDEFSKVNPPHGFDGTDMNGDCIVTREEVLAYANQKGRSYRKIGLGKFFDLVDSNGDKKVTPIEVEAAHENGLLARF